MVNYFMCMKISYTHRYTNSGNINTPELSSLRNATFEVEWPFSLPRTFYNKCTVKDVIQYTVLSIKEWIRSSLFNAK